MNAKKYTLTVTCPDKSGLIASITNSIASSKGNILNLAQHTSTDISMFFCRVDFAPEEGFDVENFKSLMEKNAGEFGMVWHLFDWAKKSRMALLVSKTSHCLY